MSIAIRAQIVANICRACPTPCSHQADPDYHTTACAACPLTPPGWGTHGHCAEIAPAASNGLGDIVASVAQPIARAIDRVAGTKIAGCGGCKARQAALNRAVPFKP